MVIHEYAGIVTELEDHDCPHCGKAMEAELGAPGSGWGVILVCNNNACPHYCGSASNIQGKSDETDIGCRYALDPDVGYKPFNLVSVCKH